MPPLGGGRPRPAGCRAPAPYPPPRVAPGGPIAGRLRARHVGWRDATTGRVWALGGGVGDLAPGTDPRGLGGPGVERALGTAIGPKLRGP